ncbi:unnamed protein product [Chrysoparadoxa australica]
MEEEAMWMEVQGHAAEELSEGGEQQQLEMCAPSQNGTRADCRFASFRRIVHLYIKSNSIYEVNIPSGMRLEILEASSSEVFGRLSQAVRGAIFDRAYREVKNMLEANLMHKFVRTPEFRAAFKAAVGNGNGDGDGAAAPGPTAGTRARVVIPSPMAWPVGSPSLSNKGALRTFIV